MSFNIGLSGIQAASSGLNVTGNNIANAGTVGFKQSRAEFADVYAASVLGSGSNPQGSGVLLLSDVSQMFKQGNIDSTNSVLTWPSTATASSSPATTGRSATPAPATSIPTSRISSSTTTATACRGYAVGPNGPVAERRGHRPQGRARQSGAANPPSIQQSYNLNSTLKPPTVTPFDPSDAATYNSSSSLGIYDSQGNSHTMSQFFIKNEPDPNATRRFRRTAGP